MIQIARPKDDPSNSNVGWSPDKNYFQALRKNAPDDSTYDYTTGSLPEGATMVVKLDGLAWPDTTQTGPWKLTVRMRQIDTGGGSSSSSSSTSAVPVTVSLLQNTTVIASQKYSASPSFDNYVLDLTVAKANITDYTKLYVSIKAGIAKTTDCSKCPVAPLQWSFNASGISGAGPFAFFCNRLNGPYILTAIGSPYDCVWHEPTTIWGLSYDSGSDTWTLQGQTGVATVVYSLAGSSFNCLGDNTLSLSSSFCSGAPATITIHPE
jgi:hypothetical protein